MCELSCEPPKLILRFGDPLCDFTATRYAPVHKFHLANRTSLEARALGVSLIARRTPFSQAKSGVLTANTTIKQKSTEWCFLALWSKCGGSNSGPHGPEPCALPAALHLDFGKILSFLQVVKSVVKVKFCEKYERGKVLKSQPVQGILGF